MIFSEQKKINELEKVDIDFSQRLISKIVIILLWEFVFIKFKRISNSSIKATFYKVLLNCKFEWKSIVLQNGIIK